MKQIILICLLVLFMIPGELLCQADWVSFTSSQPMKPGITTLKSTSQEVIVEVHLPGMYQSIVEHNNLEYKRLSIPGGQCWGPAGYPELPSIGKLIAVPQCSEYSVSVTILDSLILDNYNIFPAPRLVVDTLDSIPGLIQQFYLNDTVYASGRSFPEPLYEHTDGGFLRSQKVMKFSVFPIHYKPLMGQIVVYTHFTFTIQFTGVQSEINVLNGLFEKLTKSTLRNYSDTQSPSYQIIPSLSQGSVAWITMQTPAEASEIVADYLIITDDQFFNPAHHEALQSLADHRAQYNGYEVAVVSVNNIVSLDFPYDIPFNSSWVSERKIRSFIKMVYDGQHARHTYDGRVAFVAMIGHADVDDNDTGMPTSYDPDPTCAPNNPNATWSANDYYFSCITKDMSNQWDLLGDLFIGRISVRNGTELFNAVHKIKSNEKEYSFTNWRKINTMAYGGAFSGADPTISDLYFNTYFANWVNSISNPACSTVLINSTISGNYWNIDYVNHLNSTGSNIVFHYGHGLVSSWCFDANCLAQHGALTTDYKIENLTNKGKFPFVISQSCKTGFYSGAGIDCIGTKITSFSDTAGYVGYFGSWKNAGSTFTNPGEFPNTLQEKIMGAIFQNLSSVVGEAVLEARIGVSDMTYISSYNPLHFQHNLLADPAYNVFSQGYEVTNNTTLPPPAPQPQIITISNTVNIRPGVTLTLLPGAILEFASTGQLVIDEGAHLEIGSNVTIKGMCGDNRIIVYGSMGGQGGSPQEPVVIDQLQLISQQPTGRWDGISFRNPDLIVKLNGGMISNCRLTGELMRLECQNLQTISNTSVELNQSGVLIEGCQFSNSHICLTNNRESGVYAKIANSVFDNSAADALIRIEHYPSYSIENCNLNYSQGSGIDIYYCGWRNGKVNITGNSIQKSGSSQDLSWGIRIYSSYAAIENNLITNNRFGISCLNQSQVRISGNPDAQQPGQTQRIINNFQNQIRVSDNSFPYYLHHNIIQNIPPGETTLVYFDNKAVITPYPLENPSLFDARCNCFDNADPSGQLHPAGWFTWSVWCPPSLCSLEDDGREEFEVASASMDSALHNLAESQFKDLISSYPGTFFARESAKKLVALEKINNYNFISLRTYFDTATALNSDSLSKQLIYRLLNQCTLETGDYPQAITWFENDIMDPLSEDDSVFSLIDIGDAYLRMAADTLLKAHGNNISVNLPDLRPSGRLHHENRREEWIQLLFKDSPGANHELPAEETAETVRLIRNHPNPFTTITNLEYYQYNDGIVTLTIYDTFGRIVWHKESPMQLKGKYKCKIDLSSFSAGIYIMKSLINNMPSEKISLIKI